MSADHAKPKHTRRAQNMPTLPRFESTYSMIVQRAIVAAKARTGLTQRVRSATRELAALVPHTRERFSALSLLGKATVVLTLLAVGAAVTLASVYHLLRPGPEALRVGIQEALAVNDYVGAKDILSRLRQNGPFGDDDRLLLVTSVEAGMAKLRADGQRRVEEQKNARQYDAALQSLDAMEQSGFSGEWMLFTRAELLRFSGQHQRAGRYYARYTELYPAADKADDALFWAAEAKQRADDRVGARSLLGRLLADYPGSNFKASARRVLTELE